MRLPAISVASCTVCLLYSGADEISQPEFPDTDNLFYAFPHFVGATGSQTLREVADNTLPVMIAYSDDERKAEFFLIFGI
jgi:hypothetical protein